MDSRDRETDKSGNVNPQASASSTGPASGKATGQAGNGASAEGKQAVSKQRLSEAKEIANRPATVDRRTGLDRRKRAAGEAGYSGPERRQVERAKAQDEDATEQRESDSFGATGLERRRGPGVRRQDDRRSAEEGEMTPQQFEFVMAIETYKKVNRKMYPTWTEVLEVIDQCGYRKVLPREIQLENVPEADLWVATDPAAEAEDTGESKKAA